MILMQGNGYVGTAPGTTTMYIPYANVASMKGLGDLGVIVDPEDFWRTGRSWPYGPGGGLSGGLGITMEPSYAAMNRYLSDIPVTPAPGPTEQKVDEALKKTLPQSFFGRPAVLFGTGVATGALAMWLLRKLL